MKFKKSMMASLSLVLMLSACSGDDSAPRGNEEAKGMLENGHYESAEKTEAPAENNVSETNKDGVQILTEENEDDQKKVSLEYPKFGIEAVDQDIVDFKDNQLEVFHNLISANEDEDFKANLNIEVTPTKLSDNVVALRFNINSQLNENSNIERAEFMLVDTNEEVTMLGDSLFEKSVDKREALLNTLNHYLAEDKTYSAYIDQDKLSDWVFNEANTFENVDLTSESVIFNFDQDEIASSAAGQPRVEIPLEELTEAMSDDMVNFITEE